MQPKVFISYSWSSSTHQELVRSWADQLIDAGVEIILDIYDLKEGNDKYAFMEKMVTDKTVTHVIIISDKSYSEKADARKAGVGTESQIISPEIYNKVAQSKFIPIVCEFDEEGNPCLPKYLNSLIWIDFSTPDAVNRNWERLIRLLYGKPLYEKPEVGKPPLYITSDVAAPINHITVKLNTLKQAILQEKKYLQIYRNDFLDSCIEYAEEFRVRERPDVSSLGEKVLEDTKKLTLVRNHIIDWVLLESSITANLEFSENLINFLERLIELKSRPPEINSWDDTWFEAPSLFVYETFLYIIAALIKNQSFHTLHEILTSHYLLPLSERFGDSKFDTFSKFYAYSDTLQSVLAPEGKKLYSPAAEFIKRNADRNDISFKNIMEADLLLLLMAFVSPKSQWFPQTLYYTSFEGGEFTLFLKATQHKGFLKLAIITGIENADKLREIVNEGYERLGVQQWFQFHFTNFGNIMNLKKLDTL
jgi:hypothetical protein